MDPDVLKMAQMAGVFVAALGSLAVVMIVLATISRVIKRTVSDKPEVPRPLDDQRLVRLEQAVDTIALEVERISESQRFISKLLSDRAKEPEKIGRG
jgi:hypothetical protein